MARIFCSNCGHGVMDMDKHLKTEGHKRNTRPSRRLIVPDSPMLPGSIGEAPYPGRLNYGHRKQRL